MISLPPYSRWREIKSLFSRAWNVVWHRGTADIPLSARAYLEDMPQRNGIDRFFYWLKKEENHCRNWAYVEAYRAREIVRKAIEKGLLEE